MFRFDMVKKNGLSSALRLLRPNNGTEGNRMSPRLLLLKLLDLEVRLVAERKRTKDFK